MILEADIGNTRIKWRLLDGGKILARGQATDLEPWCKDIALQFSAGSLPRPPRLRVASVRSALVRDQLLREMGNQGIRVEFAASQAFCSGVTNGYLDPERLGVDRWLAVIAAYNRCHSACLVVDAGTSLTLDIVDGLGRHLGGYIAPGLGMMSHALTNTAALPLVQPEKLSPEPGRDTIDGIAGAQGAMVSGLINEARRPLGDTAFRVLVTGGDAPLILPLCPDAVWIPDLVLDGLTLALP